MKYGLNEFSREFYEIKLFEKNFNVYFCLRSKAYLDSKYSDMEKFACDLQKIDVTAYVNAIYSIMLSNEDFRNNHLNFNKFLEELNKQKEEEMLENINIFSKCFISSKPPEIRKYLVNTLQTELKKKKKKKTGLKFWI